MQLKSFYRKLANLTKKNNLEWRISRDDKIRCTLNSRVCCPITAILNLEVGKRVNVTNADDYADEIGLDYFQAEQIMRAADYSSKELDKDGKMCRAALLRATGLV